VIAWLLVGLAVTLALLIILLLVDAWWQEHEWLTHPGNDDELNGRRHARKPEDL
jgi:hypothetical protein